jgi:catechol 2,3-dioxygenase-like lactoylglutathione lyase family enzyme
MNIVGPDGLVFGVDDIQACTDYLIDYGLTPQEVTDSGGKFTAKDGTFVEIRSRDDSSLPEELPTGSMIRKTVYGVVDQQTLDQIKTELMKDREVVTNSDGSIESVDDMGFALAFQITVRKPLDEKAQIVNTPGSEVSRAVNDTAANKDADISPLTLSHVVYFVPDSDKMESFYRDRLGFRTVDSFENVGPFMRPAGTQDHHTLFFIQTPPQMLGIEHFTFHLASPSDLLLAGKRFVEKGYESFWGPGRHIFGSNWFWYFNSPMGAHIEYDADMDLHDDSWEARVAPMGSDSSQIFNFSLKDNWAPGGPPAKED